MNTKQSWIVAQIATAQAMAERMEQLGNTEWALRWHQIAKQYLAEWQPGGAPNGHG